VPPIARPAIVVLLLALFLAGCGFSGSASIDAPVTVYVSLPLTGPRGDDGRDAADGVRLALEQAQGKAGSIVVQAQYLDDARGRAWDPVAVGANSRKAVQDSSAAAYIGELDSEPTRASVPITNDAGIAQVSPGAGAVDLTSAAAGYPDTPDRYRPSGSASFARTVPADDVVIDAAADWAAELGVTRAAVTSDGSPFENLAAAEFRTAASDHGIEVSPGNPPPPVAATGDGTQAVYQPASERLSLPGRSPSEVEVSAELDPSHLPGKQFPSQFEQRFHRPPGPYAAYGYEAMGLILQAIRGAGTDASQFRDNVRNGVIGAHRDGTVLGSYAITSDGDTTECMIQRYRIEGGRRVPLGAACPPG
jgi:branched-chain amino acid transport system substrate-binding protein